MDKRWEYCVKLTCIYTMCRHRDHLRSWVSGFQKVRDSKQVFFLSVSASVSSTPALFGVTELRALKWSCWEEGELLTALPLSQHSVCVCVRACVGVCVCF